MTTPSFDPVAEILRQINLANPDLPLPLSTSNVTVGKPAMWENGNAEYDTTLPLTGIPEQGYGGVATPIYYKRQDLAARFSGQNIVPELFASGLTSWADVIAALNARYNANLSTEYDTPQVPFVMDFSVNTLDFVVPPGSLLYSGTLAIAINHTVLDLEVLLTNTSLGGLIPPPPPPTLGALLDLHVVPGLSLHQLNGQSGHSA